MSELKLYKITDEEYEKIIRARKRVETKRKKEEKPEIVQGFTFDFHGWDYDTSTFMIQAGKIQAVLEIDIYTKENRWRRVFTNNEYGGTYMPLDLWKNTLDEETKSPRYFGCGFFIPEAEFTEETLEYILKEFKNFKKIVIPQSIKRDQKEVDYYQKQMDHVKKLIRIKQKQLDDKSIDALIRYTECNDYPVYANSDVYSKIKSKKFLKTIKGGK